MRNPRCVALMLVAAFILTGCPSREGPEAVREGRLELVWSLHEGLPPDEPWFAQIQDVAVMDDRVYVVDLQRKTVLALDHSGGFLRTIGREGEGPGEFGRPSYATVADGGHLFVARGPSSMLERFTPEGEAVERIDHGGFGGEAGLSIERPLALDDSTFVYDANPPRRTSAEEQLEAPLLVVARGDQWQPLGQRRIDERADEVRRSLIESPDQTLVWNFTTGDKCLGPNPGEILFVRRSDPYTVFRLVEEQPDRAFSYLDVERPDWALFIEMPFEDYRDAQRIRDRRFVGDNIILQAERPPAFAHNFSFIHTLRGIARSEQKLFIYVEILGDGFAQNRTEAMVEKKLFVVDLETERLEMVVPVGIEGPASLVGALEDGSLVFAFLRSDPAVFAYRIGPVG